MPRLAVQHRQSHAIMKDRVVHILMDASRLLVKATTVQQAKTIADVAAAQEVYARRQQLGKEVEDYAYGLKIEALSRLGELLDATERATGGRRPKGSKGHRGRISTAESEALITAPTLAEMGVDFKTSTVAQQLAALPADVRQAIARREVKLTEAMRRQRRTERPQDLVLPAGIYRVLYADPPWAYGNRGVIGDDDHYGHVERHYPAMTIADLCDLPVRDHVDTNAVLFLWVTSPLLAECWPVIEAWGFTYKASIVWDKVRHNFGNYVSVRHELLLIGTRGSCLPDCPTPMPDSVMSIERSDRHSEKPAEFRALIDRLYPRGPALELFGRWTPPTGSRWTVFGNEPAEAFAAAVAR